jgi:hypothetical protein
MDITNPAGTKRRTSGIKTDPAGLAHLIVAGRHVSAAQLQEVDRAEWLHWTMNHCSDHMLRGALKHNLIRNADGVSLQTVTLTANSEAHAQCR